MERLKKTVVGNAALLMLVFILVGCSGKAEQASSTEKDGKSTSKIEESVKDDANDSSSEDAIKENSESTSVESSDSHAGETNKETLSKYTNEQIEYARVWLQLGPNQEIDELNVRHIPAGEPLNPDDETSAKYPEDVIQLAGSRLVDGSVTYSGNGDGTINVYNVPLRWDGQYPAGEEFYADLVVNTKKVSINPGDDDKVIELIKLLVVQ